MTEETNEQQTEQKEHKLPAIVGNFDFRPSHVLGSSGPLAKNLKDYAVREPQITLGEQIQVAIEEKKHLVAEAATGTGKSFANILAALQAAAGTRTPVVISTHTIALQEQLVEKDIPFLIEQLELENINVALAKGRGNYVSIRRAMLAINDKETGYQRLGSWLNSTEDGTLSSMNFKVDSTTWSRSKSDSDNCLGESCPYFSDCFYQRSKKKLADAHIIVTNHNLVLLDLKMKSTGLGACLPPYKYLIFDEGHEVETVARKVFTFELKQRDIPVMFHEIFNDNNTGFLNGMLVSMEHVLRENLASGSQQDPNALAIKGAVDAIKDLIDKNEDFFRKVGNFIGSFPMKRFTERNAIETDIMTSISVVNDCLGRLTFLSSNDHKIAIDYAMKRCSEIAMGIDQAMTLPNAEGKDYPEIVAWASSRGHAANRTYSITCAPIFLGPTMRRMVFNPLDSVIFTSATLATGGNNPFRMFESSMGLKNPMRLRLPAVFDYAKQATIVVIKDMPEQKEDNYVEAIAEQVKKFCKATKGGAFVLFTSFKVMNQVYDQVKVGLEMANLQLFCQGKDLNRKQMIEAFKRTNYGVLFGVSSFWTGVDIPGKALRNLIITKLPFPAPNDPLMQAQQEIYEKFGRNFFMERAIPMTCIMLKQGFGRLIRKSTDRGIVVVLDSRVVTKKYGPMILNALPSTCQKKYGERASKL